MDVEAVKKSVRTALAAYAEAINRADLDTAIEYFSDDPEFAWFEDGFFRYESRDEIGDVHQNLQPDMPAHTEYTEVYEHVFSAEHALISTKFATTFGDPSADGFAFAGAATINMVLIDEGWKFLAGHTSTERARPGE